MPWWKVDVSEQRLRFVVAASAPGANVTELCRNFGISRQTGHVWLNRYRAGGSLAVLKELSRRPHRIPRQTAAEVVEAIKQLREEKPDWGARKLLPVVLARHPELVGTAMSATTVHRILQREHLIALEDQHRPALHRFERQAPNELWQMDFKGPQGFNRPTGPLSIQDDFSRFLLLLQHLGNVQAKGVQLSLRMTFEACGLPEFLLIDHGTPWYNSWSPWGWTELTVWIAQQGIRIILSGVRHPQTQGKVERTNGALQRAVRKRKGAPDQQSWLDQFRYEYNYVRPHEGIGMVCPASRWQPSPRPFQPQPREWDYPSGWHVQRLGPEGQLKWEGKRWEISRALRGQPIGLEPAGDHLLVHFCNLVLRDIDVRTGKNLVLPANPFRHLQC